MDAVGFLFAGSPVSFLLLLFFRVYEFLTPRNFLNISLNICRHFITFSNLLHLKRMVDRPIMRLNLIKQFIRRFESSEIIKSDARQSKGAAAQ